MKPYQLAADHIHKIISQTTNLGLFPNLVFIKEESRYVHCTAQSSIAIISITNIQCGNMSSINYYTKHLIMHEDGRRNNKGISNHI